MKSFLPAVFLCLALCSSASAVEQKPVASGELRLGAGMPSTRFIDRKAFGADLTLRCAGLPGRLGAYGEWTHFFVGRDDFQDWFWRDKSRLVLGLDLDIGNRTSLFGERVRHYSVNETYWFTGVRIGL